MTTLADLIHRTRRHLMTGSNDRLNVLDLDVAADATTVQMRYDLTSIAPGARLAIDFEEYHSLAVSSQAAGGQVTVIPGYEGSQTSAHVAGTHVRVNPQFSDCAILQAINECIDDMPGYGLFYIKPIEFTYQPAQGGYNFSAPDFLGVWRVRHDYPGPYNDWPVLERRAYYVDPHPDPTEFPGGHQFVLKDPAAAGFKVRISYKASFNTLTYTSTPATTYALDVETTTGIHRIGHRSIPLGAAINLLGGREVKRSFLNRQPEPRRQQEVPPGAANQSMAALLRMYETSIRQYRQYLKKRYPEQTS